ncbi:MAG: Ig-like domain-containing domain [Bacteroidota bacterium]
MKIKLTYYLFFVLFLLYSCANVQAPSGGPPDATPPEIVNTYPKNGTINFDGKKVELQFTKYMNKNSVLENLYIQPLTGAEFDWSGKKLSVEFKESLLPNTTYLINLGTDYTDFRNIKPSEAFSLIFSTGEIIDTGKINGLVIDKNPQGIFIFAYDITNIDTDTFRLTYALPKYRVQVGASGNFTLQGLTDGKYRLIAVKDQFKDLVLTENQDFYSTAFQDFSVKNGKSDDALFRFGKIVDFSPPKLFSAEFESNNKVKLFFSENILIHHLSPSSIAIFDSLNNHFYKVNNYYIDNQSQNILNVILNEKIDAQKTLHISIPDSNVVISDTIGNIFNEFGKTIKAKSVTEEDASEFRFLSASIRDSSTNIPLDRQILFTFSEPVDSVINELIDFHQFSDSSNVIFSSSIINSTKLLLNASLVYNSSYSIKIPPEAIIPQFKANKVRDTISLFFKTEDNRNYGTVSGSLIDSSGTELQKIVVFEGVNDNKLFQAVVNQEGKWRIDNIRSGDYKIWIYEDRNSNNRYDFGKVLPFDFSEKFYLTGLTISVKSRWETEGITLRIGK